jgi:NTE family protein
MMALAEAGHDPAAADLIVGTSAGSSIAATLRAGVPAADLYGWTVGRPSAAARARYEHLPPVPDYSRRPRPERLWPLDVGLAARAVLRRGVPRPGLAAAGLLPAGSIDPGHLAARMDALSPGGWPDDPLWICAVRVRDGQLVVFGRDDVEATVGQAVAASSAVPALVRPLRIGGEQHVDGAVHSPTSADLLVGAGFELAVVVSTMSGGSAWNPARTYHGAVLRREVAAVRRSGTPVLVIEPSADDLAVMGHDPMRSGREAAVAEAARLSTARALVGLG